MTRELDLTICRYDEKRLAKKPEPGTYCRPCHLALSVSAPSTDSGLYRQAWAVVT